jgi:hypothetical protein
MSMEVCACKNIHATPESIEDPRRYMYSDVRSRCRPVSSQRHCHMSKNALRTAARQAGKVNSKGRRLARARQIKRVDFSTPRWFSLRLPSPFLGREKKMRPTRRAVSGCISRLTVTPSFILSVVQVRRCCLAKKCPGALEEKRDSRCVESRTVNLTCD